ncbi:MAG: BREX-1 system phosphatase PglZ type A [Clostridiales Family XIII bacterium]|nr:BREX-1 system phosphatase PglZ type A [Clostridiales Family XIII bacterium]
MMADERIKILLEQRFAEGLPDFLARRVLFWRDEEGEFEGEAEALCPDGVRFVRLTGSNNFLVKKLLCRDDAESDFLVYDPLSYAGDADDWLLDVKLYSEEFRADLISMRMAELHIEPSPEMRRAVRVYLKFLESKERRAKLASLGREYRRPIDLHIDVMAVLCGRPGGGAVEIVAAVLAGGGLLRRCAPRNDGIRCAPRNDGICCAPRNDGICCAPRNDGICCDPCNDVLARIGKYGDVSVFWRLAEKLAGYVDDGARPLLDFAAHILLTAASAQLDAGLLKGLERFVSETGRAWCHGFVQEMQRGSAADADTLFEICRAAEDALKLPARFGGADVDALLGCDVFPCIDERILLRLFSEAPDGAGHPGRILDVVERRRVTGWHARTQEYYGCLFHLAKMQEFGVAHGAGFHLAHAEEIWNAYTSEYYKMDSHYRRFHICFGNTLKDANAEIEDALKQAAEYAEGLYHYWFLTGLTENWTRAAGADLAALGYVSGVARQTDFYRDYPQKTADGGARAFVIVSDALRYAVGVELADRLMATMGGRAAAEAMQAAFPTITKFGMAALLPGGKLSAEIKGQAGGKGGKAEVFANGLPTGSLKQRSAALLAARENSIALAYSEVLRMKKQERRELTAGKEIVYIYHNAIDAAGDARATEDEVFAACEKAILEITALVKIIANDLGGTNIFITADHGFLYTYRPLAETDKIGRDEIPGDIFEIGRRYALAGVGASPEYLLPVKINEALRGFAPRGTVRIKLPGGGENYVHGGVSLQEMAVPVVVYKHARAAAKSYEGAKSPGLTLISESRTITGLMFSWDFLQTMPVGGKVQPCNYSVYIADESGAAVSGKQTAIADRAGEDAQGRVFRVRLCLKPMAYGRNKDYKLVITNGVDAPEEIPVRIDVAFADDFGFDV